MSVAQRARGHEHALTALLTVVSLALVFGAVGGVVPADRLPQSDGLLGAIPHLNALLSLLAIATIVAGVRAIRRGDVSAHRRRMLGSAAIFGAFLLLYLYRVSIEGPTEFAGPDAVERFLYLPLLAVHILLAMVCLPFVYHALVLAGTHDIAELSGTAHPRVGKIAAGLWLISFTLGIAVYGMLYLVY